MKIGLWSDSVNFPSLPLMKISAYHKSIGDAVEMIEEGAHYDKVYLSKVFNLPGVKRIPQHPPRFYADEVEKGGTGYAIRVEAGKEVFDKSAHKNLPDKLEHVYPDYGLYPDFSDTAYGFLTRGCPNRCAFCIVSPKEGCRTRQVADLDEFYRDQKYIKLMDANILACKDSIRLLEQLQRSKSQIDFTQGLDAKLITDDIVWFLNRMRTKSIHFAMDKMETVEQVFAGLKRFKSNFIKSTNHVSVYVLTNFNTTHEQDWYRVCKVREVGLRPDIRIYQKGTHDRFLTDLSGWANNPIIYKSCEFMEYVPRKDGKTCGELYKNIIGGRP